LDEGAFSSRPRKKPFRSLVSLTPNTPQINVAALEEKVFCFLVFLFPIRAPGYFSFVFFYLLAPGCGPTWGGHPYLG
jgi:hypothetical protein